MKLFSLALLAFATVAVAVPAPQAIPSPDAHQLTNVTWDPNSSATGGLPPLSDFWPYSITITESFVAEKLVVTCDFENVQGTHKFDFGSNARVMKVKVTDLWLEMQYDYNKHWATYAYGDYYWGMDAHSATTHGSCNSENGWNKVPIDNNDYKYDFRQIQLSCWLYLGDQASATQGKIESAPAHAVSCQADAVPSPNDIILHNVTFTPGVIPSTTYGNSALPPPPYDPNFWPYDVTVTEGWNGSKLIVTIELITPETTTHFNFEDPRHMVWIHINKKDMHITYNYYEHRPWFEYDNYHWALDMDSGSPHGHCQVVDNWNRPALPEGSKSRRQIRSACWIYVAGNQKRASSRSNIEDVAARDVSSLLNTTANHLGYYQFDLSITEYCEASEGTPLKARAYWTPHGAPGGELINFGDGSVSSKVSIGYASKLQIGPYDYYTHQVHFGFGGCNWDQDTIGVGSCGYCYPGAWSLDGLNCTANAAAGRSLHLNCWTAVIFDEASQDESKLLAARADPEPVTTVEAQDTITKTEVSEMGATGTSLEIAGYWKLIFHLTVTEACDNGSKKVTAHFHSGHLSADMDLWPGDQAGIDHRVPRFPPFVIGPFDYNTSRLRFAYPNGLNQCEWFDDETWKQCGECRAMQWSGPPILCPGGSRTKEMDCSFILGA